MYPSIMAHILTGILLFIAFAVIVYNISTIRALRVYRILIILLLLTVATGIHGLSHGLLEKQYNYVPLRELLL